MVHGAVGRYWVTTMRERIWCMKSCGWLVRELGWRQVLNGSFFIENDELRILSFDNDTVCTHSIRRTIEVCIYSIFKCNFISAVNFKEPEAVLTDRVNVLGTCAQNALLIQTFIWNFNPNFEQGIHLQEFNQKVKLIFVTHFLFCSIFPTIHSCLKDFHAKEINVSEIISTLSNSTNL